MVESGAKIFILKLDQVDKTRNSFWGVELTSEPIGKPKKQDILVLKDKWNYTKTSGRDRKLKKKIQIKLIYVIMITVDFQWKVK